MIFSRYSFFILLLAVFVLPFYLVNLIWIVNSVQTTGTASFRGKEISGQIGHNYTVVSFTVNGRICTFNTSDNIFIDPGTPVVLRYQKNNPSDARLDNLGGLWAGTFFYSAMPLLIIIITFLHPGIVPYRARLRFARPSPFLFLESRD